MLQTRGGGSRHTPLRQLRCAELAPAAYKALNGRAEFVVAGAPTCMDDLKALGIDQFINVKSNVLETLKAFNTKLGIA